MFPVVKLCSDRHVVLRRRTNLTLVRPAEGYLGCEHGVHYLWTFCKVGILFDWNRSHQHHSFLLRLPIRARFVFGICTSVQRLPLFRPRRVIPRLPLQATFKGMQGLVQYFRFGRRCYMSAGLLFRPWFSQIILFRRKQGGETDGERDTKLRVS